MVSNTAVHVNGLKWDSFASKFNFNASFSRNKYSSQIVNAPPPPQTTAPSNFQYNTTTQSNTFGISLPSSSPSSQYQTSLNSTMSPSLTSTVHSPQRPSLYPPPFSPSYSSNQLSNLVLNTNSFNSTYSNPSSSTQERVTSAQPYFSEDFQIPRSPSASASPLFSSQNQSTSASPLFSSQNQYAQQFSPTNSTSSFYVESPLHKSLSSSFNSPNLTTSLHNISASNSSSQQIPDLSTPVVLSTSDQVPKPNFTNDFQSSSLSSSDPSVSSKSTFTPEKKTDNKDSSLMLSSPYLVKNGYDLSKSSFSLEVSSRI